MKSIIYYRRSLTDELEFNAIKNNFECSALISTIDNNSLIIPRYSLHPFVKDMHAEFAIKNCKIINSLQQHSYISDARNYIQDLGELTFKTYYDLSEIPEGQYILKGETNSKKNYWDKLMFAKSRADAIRIAGLLYEDSLIGYQKIYAREYVPLITFFNGIGGVPITNEFRFFIAYGQVLCGAYYWDNYADDLNDLGIKPEINDVPISFLNKVINIIGEKSNFYVIDVAQKENGNWIVVELNDGCSSGLSGNDPEALYLKLKNVIELRSIEK